ncbi:MAG: tRNA epoxyqueuosine(34) reductase QueG [Firmicutes bacterium]|nr:tRNA epoxyqueuosine(34) reductase QueG [Bacillota bacterium]
MILKDYIKKEAVNLGIDILGFTDTVPFDNLVEILENREKMNYHTEFEEKDINLRIDPKKLLPEGKSIIVAGLSYNLDNKIRKNKEIKGMLSRSSWGKDYHDVLYEKLKSLTDSIKKNKNFKYKIYVDTGPLIDREVAKRSGIGWYGKNCSIINDYYGSFIFLGYIITDLDIKKDDEVKQKCGDCRLCIDACPTKALKENYKVDASRCISYLTQTKKKIPYELREKMEAKVYGCDTCQMVCPKNKDVYFGDTIDFLPKITNGSLDIKEMFALSNKEFKNKYGHISGSWRGKNILKRNILILLGNIKNKDYLNLVKDALKEDSEMLREYAAWALLKIDKELGKELIINQLKKEKSIKVKKEFTNLLKYFN